MMMMKGFIYFLLASFVLLLYACKPTVPKQYISPDDMVDVLYDYHVSQAMADQDTKDGKMGYNRRVYFLAVLKKHGLTEAEFDSSMIYYYRRADYLRKIYSKVQDRMSEEATGTAVTEIRRRFVSGSDTADIWRENRSYVLSPAIPYNKVVFTVKADTAFRKGDTYLLTFDTNFLYQSGTKDATLHVAVRYSNDSIVVFTQNVSTSGMTQMRIRPNDDAVVRDMRGFIYVDRGRDESSTLKLMFIDNVQLLRMRKQEEAGAKSADSGAKSDSLSRSVNIARHDSISGMPTSPRRDSIVRPSVDKKQMPQLRGVPPVQQGGQIQRRNL